MAQSPPPHDIESVDTAPLGGAISVPLPAAQRKQLKKYDIPELVGARQALGSQLIDGALPRPIADYVSTDAKVHERISFFEGGLVVVDITGGGATIRKRLILPPDTFESYTKAITAARLSAIPPDTLAKPRDGRRAALRIYEARAQGTGDRGQGDTGAPANVSPMPCALCPVPSPRYVEREYDPMSTLPKPLADQIVPMQDLLRAIYQDRTVSNSVANYAPKEGDELVADDSRVWRVQRVIAEKIVVLECTSQPMTIYVDAHDLYNYFIGKPGTATR